MDELEKQLNQVSRLQDKLFEAQIETDKQLDETYKEFSSTAKEVESTKKIVTYIGKKLSNIETRGRNKIEGLAHRLTNKILKTQFACHQIIPNHKTKRNGRTYEMDMLGYNDDLVIVVEVKQVLKQEHVIHMAHILDTFYESFPEHCEKKCVGLLVGKLPSEAVIRYAHTKHLYIGIVSNNGRELEIQ